ncbi:MAG: ATP-grasp domain-containing protein [Gammaproteobacteria bacterium]|nr:ATP-grasp domain-containing protein [Gammaproteobacteria bacterium]
MKLDRASQPLAVLVDPIFAGVIVADEFLKHRRCIAVISKMSLEQALGYSFNPNVFEQVIIANEYRFEDLVAKFKDVDCDIVFSATEFGIELTDQLSQALNLKGNDPSTSYLRRDKFAMVEAIRAAKIPAAAQVKTNLLNEAVKWLETNPCEKFVIKPVDSGGSDNVYICDNKADLAPCFRDILGTINILRCKNTHLLVQEYLEGQEYVINTASLDGTHKLTDVWKVSKRLTEQGRNIYDFDDLCNPQDQEVQDLSQYINRVLDVLGVKTGAGHSEVIITRNGPYLIETAARVSGAANPVAIQLATGSDQVELASLAYLDETDFSNRSQQYQLVKHARSVHIISSGNKTLSHEKFITFLSSLPSFVNINFRTKDGAVLTETVDVKTCPGAFFLVHEDKEIIAEDYRQYRIWEAKNI